MDKEEITVFTQLREKLLNLSLSENDNNKKNVLQNLAWVLEFHNRENKPTWWRLFDRLGLTEIDLYDDMDCLVGLQRTKKRHFFPRLKQEIMYMNIALTKVNLSKVIQKAIMCLERKILK